MVSNHSKAIKQQTARNYESVNESSLLKLSKRTRKFQKKKKYSIRTQQVSRSQIMNRRKREHLKTSQVVNEMTKIEKKLRQAAHEKELTFNCLSIKIECN